MRLQVLMFYQDDPKKCTAAKMVKFGLAQNVKKIKRSGLVLDPFSDCTLLPRDRQHAGSIVGIDCSWRLADQEFSKHLGSVRRKLPPLFAGNPTNYSKLSMLTTAEAMAGALFILGFKDQALELLDKFRWGHTFYELNEELLGDYAKLAGEDHLMQILREYGLDGASQETRQPRR
ncbi:MAG: DUF367 family protein [Nitrosopumilus sp. H8]|nr:MAG: DUF367 family protein [Nitrosopumilus sp. H8]